MRFHARRCSWATTAGPSHLAGIIGIPTVSIFGPSNPALGPLGPRVQIVAGPLEEITVENVLAAGEAAGKSG